MHLECSVFSLIKANDYKNHWLPTTHPWNEPHSEYAVRWKKPYGKTGPSSLQETVTLSGPLYQTFADEVAKSQPYVWSLSLCWDKCDPWPKLRVSVYLIKTVLLRINVLIHILYKWYTSRNKTLATRVCFSNKVLFLQSCLNMDPLYQNANK